jgi:hypothetical protein
MGSPTKRSENGNGIPKTILSVVPKTERRGSSSSGEFRVTTSTTTTKEKSRASSSGDNVRNGGITSNTSNSTRKESFFVQKGSTELKWQRAKMVVGALEVKSEPFFQPKDDMKPLYTKGEKEESAKIKFEDALQAWEDLKLRQKFIIACGDLPDAVCCCGLSQGDSSSTIKQYVTLLNDGWVKYANKKLVSRGFKIDTFHWYWQNNTGKSETNILLIRFFELSTYKFRRASQEGSLDLDDMLLDDEDKVGGGGGGGGGDDSNDDSSQYSVSHHGGEEEDDPSPAVEQVKR